MTTGVVIVGRVEAAAIVSTPAPGISKSMVFVPATARLESRIAWRSEPGPPSAVVVTSNRPLVTTIGTWAWIGAAPSNCASRFSVGCTLVARRWGV